MTTSRISIRHPWARSGALLLVSLCAALAHAESPRVSWERIQGIDPNPAGGQNFADIAPVAFPWSVSSGRASVNTATGRLRFAVKGLSIGASPSPLARIGTTGIVAQVKGTLLCHLTGEYVDTDPADLSATGDAQFVGALPYVPACDAHDLVFLLRVAAVVPNAPPVTGLWLAHGAVRKLH